jgi:hypothetical protein
MRKLAVIPKKAIWQLANWQTVNLVNSIIRKLKSEQLVCLSFLWWEFFLRERKKIFCTYCGPFLSEGGLRGRGLPERFNLIAIFSYFDFWQRKIESIFRLFFDLV